MKTEPNSNAFPDSEGSHCLTKREYFAAMAMQGILANSAVYLDKTDMNITGVSVKMADVLITELNK